MEYEEVKKKIKEGVMRGDVGYVCKKAGYSTTGPFYAGMRKKTWEELTPAELKVINLMVDRIQNHREVIAKIKGAL